MINIFNPYKREEKIQRFSEWIHPYLFLIVTGFILLYLTLGWWLFYHYGIREMEKEVEAPENLVIFKQLSYQLVLEKWLEKEELFNQIDPKEYRNPFTTFTPEG